MDEFEKWWTDTTARKRFLASSVYRADFHLAFTAGRALGKREGMMEIADMFEGQYTDSCPGTTIEKDIRKKAEAL